MTRLHMRYGIVRNPLSQISRYLVEGYVHTPKENMSKIDKKVEKCIFIGYKAGMKVYNIWNP
jgi:hypothetical protein